jgi:hypothetical protein
MSETYDPAIPRLQAAKVTAELISAKFTGPVYITKYVGEVLMFRSHGNDWQREQRLAKSFLGVVAAQADMTKFGISLPDYNLMRTR